MPISATEGRKSAVESEKIPRHPPFHFHLRFPLNFDSDIRAMLSL
jgi:hypothetical protein